MGLAMLRRALEAVMLRSTQSARNLSLGDTETDSMRMRFTLKQRSSCSIARGENPRQGQLERVELVPGRWAGEDAVMRQGVEGKPGYVGTIGRKLDGSLDSLSL